MIIEEVCLRQFLNVTIKCGNLIVKMGCLNVHTTLVSAFINVRGKISF